LRAGNGELEIGEACEEAIESDGGLDASELGAEAEVDAGAEGEVTVRLAVDVQPIGIFEDSGIAIGGGEAAKEHLTAADRLAAELGVRAGVAGLGDLGERNIAEQLLLPSRPGPSRRSAHRAAADGRAASARCTRSGGGSFHGPPPGGERPSPPAHPR
jgi:hypothetical protein